MYFCSVKYREPTLEALHSKTEFFMTRKELYELIEIDEGTNVWSHLYDIIMFIIIILSVVPLMFWEHHQYFTYLEAFTTTVFIIDYILRWITADYRLGQGHHSFVSYPYSFWAIIDLLSILPSFHILGDSFRILRTLRMLKTLRLLKALRYSDQMFIFMDVLKKERKVLSSVLFFAATYIFITALVMFNFEPRINPLTGEETFRSFLDALYWSTVTLTTVGYGDLTPATDLGRLISMFSALFGIAVIALPSGIITASYLDELHKIERKKEREKLKKEELLHKQQTTNNNHYVPTCSL